MQALPQFLPSGCSVLLTLKFSQRRARVKRGFVTALQMVPSLVVVAQHTAESTISTGGGIVCVTRHQHKLAPFVRPTPRTYLTVVSPSDSTKCKVKSRLLQNHRRYTLVNCFNQVTKR